MSFVKTFEEILSNSAESGDFFDADACLGNHTRSY